MSMPKFYVRFQAEIWHGPKYHDAETIAECIVEMLHEGRVREWAEDMIDVVAAAYPFPFGDESEGYTRIKADEIDFVVMPLDQFLERFERKTADLEEKQRRSLERGN